MNTEDVANRLVELCRAGKNEEAINELYSDEIVSLEPEGAPERISKGRDAVLAKDKSYFDNIEKINEMRISNPTISDNYFTVATHTNIDFKGGEEAKGVDMDELAVYKVENGKIVWEEFFYTPNQQ